MRSHSLRTRLMLLVGVSVLPAFLLVCFNAWQARTEVHHRAQSNAERLVHNAVSRQAALIDAARQLLSALSKLPEVQVSGPTCQPVLSRLLELYPRYSNLGVIARDGRVPCSALPMKGAVDLSDRSYFLRALESGDFAVGDYQVGRITGEPSVNFGYPVRDNKGEIQSVVYAALDLGWLGQLLANQDLPPGSTLTLFDPSGTVLAQYPPDKDPLSSYKGEVLTYAKPLRPILTGGARIEVRIPHSAIFSAVNLRFVRDVGLVGLVVLLAMAIAWFGSDTLVLQRIKTLVKATKRLREGALGTRTGLPAENDELGHLAETFDEMAAGLQRREKALEASSAELHKVNRALRTLSAGNRALLAAHDELWLVEEICRVVVDVGEYRSAAIVFRDMDQTPPLRVVAQAGVLNAQEVRCLDALENIIQQATPQIVSQEQTHALLALPLISNGESVEGVLVIQATREEGFDETEIELLNETAQDLTFGIGTLRIQGRERQAQEKIHQMEWYEPLTGLPNRLYLHQELEQLLGSHATGQYPLALLLLDLDRFRDINTGLGYEQGDRILQAVGPRLKANLPEQSLVAHLGEDEFAVVLPNADSNGAIEMARRLLSALEAPIQLEGVPLDITASLGIAIYPGHGRNTDALLRAADAAMSRAKLDRRGIAIYMPERDHVSPQRLALAGELRRAIEAEQLEMYCQPKVNLRTRAVESVEALLRWRHPQRGQVSPGEFIPLAEETGLIGPLTDWVLQAAARQYHIWQDQELTMPIAVNLSARNLLEPGLISGIETLLTTWGMGAEHLGLELTESALMQHPQQALETLNKLSGMGVKLYIDDFGTGYSSLSYLHKLPIDAVKIDKSFVMDMATNNDSYRIVESTIVLAHKLGKRVVAEGVEDETVLRLLTELECDAAQGFYISRPMEAGQYKQWLEGEGRQWVQTPQHGNNIKDQGRTTG